MLRALYPFKKTHPTSLSFTQGDLFVELPGAANDKNWFYVMDGNAGAGYIPRNYVFLERIAFDKLATHIDGLKDRVRLSGAVEKEKAELIAKLEAVCSKYKSDRSASITQRIPVPDTSPPIIASPRSVSPKSTHSSDRSATPPKSGKKRAAPQPPHQAVNLLQNSEGGVSESPDGGNSQSSSRRSSEERRGSSEKLLQHRRASIVDPNDEQIRSYAREIVELVRVETGLSHTNSQSVVQTVLQYVSTNFQRLDRNVPALLAELDKPVLNDKEDIVASADTRAIESLFEQLTQAKDDEQQRNWMLFEDEATIRNLLQNLSESLSNSDRRVSTYVMSKFKYFYILNLVEYFQMETRWALRKPLIENFMIMCSLDPVIISLMLSSVLPLELAQELFQYTENVPRLRHCALLLTIIFSRGEPMPVHYFSQLGSSFVTFLLDYIEAPPTPDSEHEIPDVFIGLALSYNLQFPDIQTNVMVSCLSGRSGAKTWTEKVLLLLNREEDPTAIVGRDTGSRDLPHSVHKIIMDMFLHDSCHQLFYTNDIYVLIDIIVRQLSDLCPEEPKRRMYLSMSHIVLTRSEYSDHLHRFKDLEKCFIRILDEEEVTNDKNIVLTICREVAAFNSLL
ncbi:hypothetical protein TCAL_02794 [Tigriopus californicus]|uniref:SH3 domain-containing protein n=1 Tax=Tigriopus californicus TaxID=6832 RepID=A0A553NZQ2_TIGCA|nr:NCK-interacting protein with SH3 domain-like [Tigriopus californicus]TRY70898.1 hypothetical protein TCAL_02794 [Tigriopus californicus]|eukprot:TCALIF_02794-PA protein Name:"Similar to Nckipsd NCK-interacting protein with SH3 domain (Mus musculus)" AED:0.00 eAED:0.01 QI:0/-1/0/1/-1/1/1/0/620